VKYKTFLFVVVVSLLVVAQLSVLQFPTVKGLIGEKKNGCCGDGELTKRMFDVVISTFQSEHKLKECLDALIGEIPINRIIVVDGGSTDNTLKILSQYPRVELYVKPELNLGESRAFGFEKVKTDWFFQIDSDIVLRKGWLKEIMKDMDNAEVIESGKTTHWIIPNSAKESRRRALFGACLIKTEAIKGIQLNCRLMEDELTRRILVKRGFRWLKTDCVLADHYSNPVRYRNSNFKLQIKGINYPLWGLSEEGGIDRVTGVSFLGAFKRFFGFYYSATKSIILQLHEALRYSTSYMKGYLGKGDGKDVGS
jgi:glycosyltransferase involved in cell wall biosynthesis